MHEAVDHGEFAPGEVLEKDDVLEQLQPRIAAIRKAKEHFPKLMENSPRCLAKWEGAVHLRITGCRLLLSSFQGVLTLLPV